jgi:hypothetical protein
MVVPARATFHFLYRGQHHLHNWQLGGVCLVMVVMVVLLVVRAIHHSRTGGSSTRSAGDVHACELVLAVNHFFGNVRGGNSGSILQSHRYYRPVHLGSACNRRRILLSDTVQLIALLSL